MEQNRTSCCYELLCSEPKRAPCGMDLEGLLTRLREPSFLIGKRFIRTLTHVPTGCERYSRTGLSLSNLALYRNILGLPVFTPNSASFDPRETQTTSQLPRLAGTCAVRLLDRGQSG